MNNNRNKGDKIKVLVVDDSSTARVIFTEILNSDQNIEVVGTAIDPIFARQKIATHKPDVITLDIEMPRMDGLTFLSELMKTNPIPVIMVSSASKLGGEKALEALSRGAVEFVSKVDNLDKSMLHEVAIQLIDKVKAAAGVDVKKLSKRLKSVQGLFVPQPKLSADVVIPQKRFANTTYKGEKVVVIGASTGGTEALAFIAKSMPENSPPMVIVQHMPELFTKTFADRLNIESRMEFKEAENGDLILPGRALVAPGNFHTLILSSGQEKLKVEVRDGPLVSRHRPSVNVLFRSTAQKIGKKAVGLILTGMGDDGAQGMAEMKNNGAYNIAQDENSSVVFGMPKEAIKAGAVDTVLPLEKIPGEILKVSGFE